MAPGELPCPLHHIRRASSAPKTSRFTMHLWNRDHFNGPAGGLHVSLPSRRLSGGQQRAFKP
eukprot:1180630-Prorocentrum_minimum.AAC.3